VSVEKRWLELSGISRRLARLKRATQLYGWRYSGLLVWRAISGRMRRPSDGGQTPHDASLEGVFKSIYEHNRWGNRESRSGAGSTLEATTTFRHELEGFLASSNVKSLFDAPCGDWNWMVKVQLPTDFEYIGGEIVASLVENLTQSFAAPNVSFVQHDVTSDRMPLVDVWLCRDCLFHLPEADVWKSFQRFAESGIGLALVTSHQTGIPNVEISAGDFRFLDLQQSPFNFGSPLQVLREDVGDEMRYVGVWTREQVLAALASSAGIS
jgi:hypothetical protein